MIELPYARDGKGWEMLQVTVSGTVLGRGIPMRP
jgi:hypothetical protein